MLAVGRGSRLWVAAAGVMVLGACQTTSSRPDQSASRTTPAAPAATTSASELTALGARQVTWDAAHVRVNEGECLSLDAYDPDPALVDGRGCTGVKYALVTPDDAGRIISYFVVFPETDSLDAMKTALTAELPDDARLVSQVTGEDCMELTFQSERLASVVFAGSSDGVVDVDFHRRKNRPTYALLLARSGSTPPLTDCQ